MRRLPILAAFILAFACLARAQAAPVAQPTDPSSLPFRDHHEGLLIAAAPYLDSERAKAKFGKASPFPAGVVAIEVFLHNETTQALRLNLDTVRLLVRPPGQEQQRLEWLDLDTVATLVAYPNRTPNPEATRSRWPRGTPGVHKDKKTQQMEDLLKPFALDVSVIPPLATLHGFLFFDLDHAFNLLDTSSLYVPDIKSVAGNHSLTYFEVIFHPLPPTK